MAYRGVGVRLATEGDLLQIQRIFEHWVLKTSVSCLIQKPPFRLIEYRYKECVDRKLPYMVACDLDDHDHVVGYAYASPFRGSSMGYGHTVEISLYVHPQHTNNGIGSRLIERLLDALRFTRHIAWELGHEFDAKVYPVRKVMAIMAVDETVPDQGIRLRNWYLKRGFEEVGRLKAVAFKRGRM
ncbi:uncharacterized protein Z519_12122 [Cladophialophora bantiana CBS 173.52]|uniref:N-acetyltransferase domain-containing protein n=1 Tax=Cladophialophora bantiana (strain ATCC 10958 / CBS 173.52 / CDC B-1940 / NIH 8579) TaxID=1442370 RepID=A0A0D2HS64_CLAB1|nr:uncharacterized protein Z519_12122 [Cladophialophora bantiana CBS 173.52]KIW87219.1 hypothetical protein Z519_12122 [Cladophialophora bantiana CBS 173.52]